MSKKSLVQQLIEKKQKAQEIVLPKGIKEVLEEIFENNDQYPKNSHMRISADDAVEILKQLGFNIHRNTLCKIAKQLGRQSYASK